MRSAFNFTKYFKNFERSFKTTYTRFRIRTQASLNQYHLLASLFVGTVVIKHDDLLKCVNFSTQDGAQNYGSKGRLLFIRNRIHDDKNIDHFIQGLRQSGVDVIEVDLEATSDYMASLLQPKDINFIATNNEGDILEIPHGDENAQQKLRSFFRSVHEINKFSIHDFNRLAEKLKDNERIVFTYIPEQKDYKVGPFNPYDTYNKNKVKDIESLANTYRQLKNYHLSDTTSFFIIKDPVIAQSFQLSQDDIGEIYTIKKSSIYNNFETNTRINGQRVQISRIDLSDQERVDVQRDPELKSYLVKRKMYENCIDHVNYFQTQNELDNIRGLLNQLNVKKVFIYYRSNDDESFSKIVTKLTKVKKDLKRDDFCILATNNLGLLRKEFKIIHEGFTNAFRFIDYSRPWTWQPPNDYTFEIITSENQDHRDYPNANENPSQKQSPVNLSIPLRSSFEEKPTRKRIKNYLTSALDGQPPIYFESNPKTLYYFSKNLVGKRFEDEVLKSDENVIIEFFKPTCPSCAVLSGSYEEFAKIVSQLQESMILEKGSGDSRLEYSLINKYKIQNPHKFKNLRVYRYNIYNESPVFPSPAATPLIFLFKNGQKTKPVLIDLVEDKININDSQKVIRNLIRIIDES